jgi:transcriptional regulator with XRE-family HTH domain
MEATNKTKGAFFRKQLKKALNEKKLNQQDLSKMLNLSRQQVSFWINSSKNPSVDSLRKISKALEKDVNFFLENSGELNVGGNIGNTTVGGDFIQTTNVNNTTQDGLEKLKNDNSLFRKNLRLAMANLNLTQKELATRMGINQTQISIWINGHAKPSYLSINKIYEALGKDSTFFLGKQPSSTAPESKGGGELPTENIETLKKDMELLKKEIEILKLQNDLLSKALLIERKK